MFLFQKSFLSLAATGLLVLSGTGYVQAQEQTTPNTQPTQQENTMEITNAKIDAFAETAIEVISIQQEMVPQIKAASEDTQKKDLFQDMQKQMMDVVEESDDITVAEYNAISQEAMNNPNLANKIETKIKEIAQ